MRRSRLAATLLASLLLPAFMAGSTLAVTPGNNGTVKIDGLEFDNPDDPDNEPHVGCWFQVDFYGYDQGDLDATATLQLHPPTLGDGTPLVRHVAIGEDPAGGGTDLDATIWYKTESENGVMGVQEWLNLNGPPEQHPIQGFHVKLTVNAEGSIGADVKHKVFWIKCHAFPV